jgi:hypothetical protein
MNDIQSIPFIINKNLKNFQIVIALEASGQQFIWGVRKDKKA